MPGAGDRRFGLWGVGVLGGTVALAGLLTGGCSSGPDRAEGVPPPPDPLAWLSGSFTSAGQAAEDEMFIEVLLHHAPIWTDRDDGPWLYAEQATAGNADTPYRQRVYRLVEANDSDGWRWMSVVHELPEPDAVIGAWREPSKLAGLTPDDLIERSGCQVTLVWNPDLMTFEGSTPDVDCRSSLRGAVYATSEVSLYEDRLESWDRGWDTNGAQVWGSVAGPYVFMRTDG